jgi:hypothetical protein
MAEAYVVGMVVPQEHHVEEVGASDDIDALFGDSSDSDMVAPTTTDEQVALMASFETAHHEERKRQFMATEREALAAMLVVRANTAREAACGCGGGGGGAQWHCSWLPGRRRLVRWHERRSSRRRR